MKLNNGEKRGRALRLYQCCREIRIQANLMTVGNRYKGFNTLTDEEETWECLKLEKDHNDHVMQQIINTINKGE